MAEESSKYLPTTVRLKRSPIEQPDLGEQHGVQERHLDQLFQLKLDGELVFLLLHHKGHAGGSRPDQRHSLRLIDASTKRQTGSVGKFFAKPTNRTTYP